MSLKTPRTSTKLIFLCILLLLIPQIQSQVIRSPSLIIELNRHGSRGPNDDLWDPTWKDYEVQELSAVGMRAHYILGKQVRMEYEKRYGKDFLVSNWTSEKVYVRSTHVPRTIMSAYAHLYGLFEGAGYPTSSVLDKPTTYPPYNNTTLIQNIAKSLVNKPSLPNRLLPFPDHIVSYSTDYILAAEGSCTKFGSWKELNLQSLTYKTMISKYQYSLDYFRTLGFNLTTWFLINDFADTVIVNHSENRTLPGNLTWDSEHVQNLIFLYNWGSVFTQFGQDMQKQIIPTPLLNYILDISKASINGTSKEQLHVLSAHDDSLLTFLTPLGIVTPECIYANFLAQQANKEGAVPYPNCQYPTFASSIRFEVYGYAQPHVTEPYFRIFYNGNEINPCNSTGPYCGWKDFAALVNRTTKGTDPAKFPTICENPPVNGVEQGVEKEIEENYFTWGLAIVIGMLVLLNLKQLVKYVRYRKEQRDTESLLPTMEEQAAEVYPPSLA